MQVTPFRSRLSTTPCVDQTLFPPVGLELDGREWWIYECDTTKHNRCTGLQGLNAEAQLPKLSEREYTAERDVHLSGRLHRFSRKYYARITEDSVG